MTTYKIALKLYSLIKTAYPRACYICTRLEVMLLNEEITAEEYWGFKELLWTFVNVRALSIKTKCEHLDYHHVGPWFNSKQERLAVLNKIINTNITITAYGS